MGSLGRLVFSFGPYYSYLLLRRIQPTLNSFLFRFRLFKVREVWEKFGKEDCRGISKDSRKNSSRPSTREKQSSRVTGGSTETKEFPKSIVGVDTILINLKEKFWIFSGLMYRKFVKRQRKEIKYEDKNKNSFRYIA